MARTATVTTSEMAILRRVVDPQRPFQSPEAARAILRLGFSTADRARMNRLAAKNRQGRLNPEEEEELNNFIRVGQTLGILQSKARRSLKAQKARTRRGMNRSLLDQVRRLADNRCDYCRMPAWLDPLPFQLDHIVAAQHGGARNLENLAWSCLHCNKHKGPNIAGIDPTTYQLVPLFHPRRQRWERHFRWNGPMLLGQTRGGRATIRVLAINDPDMVAFRAELMREGTFF